MLLNRVLLSPTYSGLRILLPTWQHATSMRCVWNRLRWIVGSSMVLDRSNYRTPVIPANLEQLVMLPLVLSSLHQMEHPRNVSACTLLMSVLSGQCIRVLPQQHARHVHYSTAY